VKYFAKKIHAKNSCNFTTVAFAARDMLCARSAKYTVVFYM